MILIELFAGVGGFRLGFEGQKRKARHYSATSRYKKRIPFEGAIVTGYSNQWEPGAKFQIASEVYKAKFGEEGHDNTDISVVSGSKILNTIRDVIPEERFEEEIILAGGFPCQDYSVANGLHTSKGLIGRKGVLWWDIYRIISQLKRLKRQPTMLLLENVDRLLSSPAKSRGMDFAIMISCLDNLGYVVEYKIINAGEYGLPQKRKRVFICAYLKTSNYAKGALSLSSSHSIEQFVETDGILFGAFNGQVLKSHDTIVIPTGKKTKKALLNSLLTLEDEFPSLKQSPFGNAGIVINGIVHPFKTQSKSSKRVRSLRSVLVKEEDVDAEFYVPDLKLWKWKHYRGAKKIARIKPNGEEYIFTEGAMQLFDDLSKPGRTIITSEGGPGASRTKHLIKRGKRQRRLVPVELERMNQFPDNHTNLEGVGHSKRAFLMGNALVVGVVERIRDELIRRNDSIL
jgi:DNA (cytosine-5)-methyltransferase 1